jgi:hypothetical protein
MIKTTSKIVPVVMAVSSSKGEHLRPTCVTNPACSIGMAEFYPRSAPLLRKQGNGKVLDDIAKHGWHRRRGLSRLHPRSLLIGAFVASYSAIIGGRHRDD